MEELVKWFISSGGSLDHSAMSLKEITNEGRGAVALKDIPKGHTLFSIPRDLTLSTRTSELPRLLGAKDWKRFRLDKGWSGIILCMMWEAALGARSRWSAYLRELPATFDTPIFWSEDDLKELQGCTLVDKLGKQEAEANFRTKISPLLQARTDALQESLHVSVYSLENYHVMGSRLLSRSFQVERWEGEELENYAMQVDGGDGDEIGPQDFREVDEAQATDNNDVESQPEDEERAGDSDEDDEDPSDVAMVPMADMLNARYGSENVAKLFYEATHLNMVTTRDIKAGEQIYNTYGDLPNSVLLRRYGHVDLVEIPGSGEVGNPADVVEVSGDLVSSAVEGKPDTIKDRIDWWLEEGGDDVFVLDMDTLLPDVLVSFSKLLLISGDEWKKAQRKGKPPKPSIDDNETISVIMKTLQKRIAQYPTSLEHDEELLKTSEMTLNKRNATIVRVGEKRLLKAAMDKLIELASSLSTRLPRGEAATAVSRSKRKRESLDHKEHGKKGKS